MFGLTIVTNCIDDNILVEFVEGSLSTAEAMHVERHVSQCASCRQRVITLGTSPSRIAEAPTAPAGVGAHLTLQPGTEVGRFQVSHEIGRGGMGIVFAAHDPKLQRKVALKLLHSAANTTEKTAQAQLRLLNEARAMAHLDHPNIVTAYEAGTFRQETYIAMELARGETLNQWLRRWSRSPYEIVAVFKQAASALDHVHTQGLAHGDFKPENLLVDDEGRVRVTDFGLSRWFADEVRTGTEPVMWSGTADSEFRSQSGPEFRTEPEKRSPVVMGTPRYMAPEQFAGRPADARSDQFSFCVAFYEALYGHHPFAHATALSLLKLPQDEALAPIFADASADTAVPAWLHNALLKGLNPDPDDRYRSMRELSAALAAPMVRFRRRHITAALAVAMILVCFVGFAMGAWSQSPAAVESDIEPGGDGTTARVVAGEPEDGETVPEPATGPETSSSPGNAATGVPIGMHEQQGVYAAAGPEQSSPAVFRVLHSLIDGEIDKAEKQLTTLRALRHVLSWISLSRSDDAGDQADGPAVEVNINGPSMTPRKNGLTPSRVARGVQQRWRDLEVCFSEWRERQPEGRNALRVRLYINRAGRGRIARMTGLGDKVVRKCVAGALEAVEYPKAPHSTLIDLKFRSKGSSLKMRKKLVR